jgi:hypothetical protein
MFNLRNLLTTVVFVLAIPVILSGQNLLEDPYVILNKYFEVCGGLDRMKAERTYYKEAKMSIAGLEGSYKEWVEKPDRSRSEIDLNVFKAIHGDNGEYEWTLDTNGKLQRITNPENATIKRKEVKKRSLEYEFVDPNSDIFTVVFEGVEEIEDKQCYTVKISNSINSDYNIFYINTSNFLLEKGITIEAENSSDSYFGDYREVDGLKVPFWTKQIIHQTGQEVIINVTEYNSNAAIDPSLFNPPEEGKKDYHFTEGNSVEDIPIRFIGGHLYVPVIINCNEKYWVIDTGAGMSVIDEGYAKELGLEMKGDLKGVGAGGNVDVQFTTIPPFSIQGIEFTEQTVAAINIDKLNRLLSIEIAGILGFDFLSRFVTKIDYANELVSFYDPGTFKYSGGGHEVGVHIKNKVFMVEAVLDNEHTGTWLFDLGAGSTSLNGVFAHKNGYIDKKGILRLSHGAANAFQTKSIKGNKIEFADFTVDNPKLHFPYGGIDTLRIFDELGTLGNSLFRNFVIYCDYANERLIVEKGEKFNKKFPEDRTGLQLFRNIDDNSKIEVMYVAEGTPGEKAGFKTGDIIKSINKINIRNLDGLSALRNLLKEEPGTKYNIIIDRDGREKNLKLKL